MTDAIKTEPAKTVEKNPPPASDSLARTNSNSREKFSRLPDFICPEHYDLKITVDPDAGNFSGEESVRIDFKKETDAITLHARDLAVSNASLNGQALSVSMNPETQTVLLGLERPAALGKAPLKLFFSGVLNDQMRGLYLSKAKHKGASGTETLENYAFTQFEAIDARRMFPCFDEPGFKATFKLTVASPKKFHVLSNMPETGSEIQGEWKTTAFATTPRMSTYLLALAVARLVPSPTVKVGKTRITVWTRPEDAGQTRFALEAAQKTLSYLNRYFKKPYSLPKMDLVAVPDFSAGAMENWGAIFFRDSAVLIDPKMSSIKAKQRVDEVVSHEIVHQWFGDLVTMSWWDDLWLNESFATWLAYKVVDFKRPRWRTWQNFERERRSALAIDALKNTRTVSSPVSNPAQIEAMFDVLTYEKGGSVLRMIENFLTENKFRAGVREYMEKHQYANTQAADLWNQLKSASGKPVDDIAKDWLTQEGYPIVSVESLSPDHRLLKLSQHRFMIDGTKTGLSQLWTLPIVIRYQDSLGVKTARVMLKDREMTVAIPARGVISWLYPNADETGYYRVSLDESLRAAALKNGRAKMTVIERSGFLADLWAQSKAGELSIAAFLDALLRFKEDASRMILEDVSGYLKALYYGLVKEGEKKAFSEFVQRTLNPHLKRLGKPKKGETDEAALSRAAVFLALGSIAPTAPLLAQVKKDLALYLKDPVKLSPILVFPVLSIAALNGNARNFNAYRAHFEKARTPEVRDNFLAAMTDFKDPAITKEMLRLTWEKGPEGQEIIRGQDAWRPVARLLGNPWSQGEAWNFVKANWSALRKKVGGKGAERIIQGLAGMTETRWLKEIKEFFNVSENQVPSAARSLAQTLELIEAGIKFKEAQSAAFADWLKLR